MENQTAADEKLALEKRKQAQEENRINRQKALDSEPANEDSDVLDALLQKLRNGDTVGRRTRRTRPSVDSRVVPLSFALEGSPAGDTTADIARDMLAQLQSQGFVTSASSSMVAASQRRRRRRTETASENSGSPLVTEIHEIQEEMEEMPAIMH